LIPVAIVACVFGASAVVMLLWNALLPAVFGISLITFWQAMGILVLSKILFGGCRMGHRHHGHHLGHRHREMKEKRMNMSAEDREQMKKDWMCKSWHTEKPE